MEKLRSLFSSNNNVTKLKNQLHKLACTEIKVRLSVNEAIRNGKEIGGDVQTWLTDVDEIIAKADKRITEDASQAKTSCSHWACPNFKLKLSMKVEKKLAEEVSEIESKGSIIYGKVQKAGYKVYESRSSTLKAVMEALTSDDIKMIGIFGMSGVGKTMLVHEVAKQVQQNKVFDKAVTITVSRTPDLKMMQGQIADMLHFKFNEENIEGRAARLRKQLEKENEILIIIDDIWEKLDLETLGISFGDDPKRCKLLFTSRSKGVLHDMGIQKNFSLGALSDEEGRYLFEKNVDDLDGRPDLRPLGVEIVKECAGLPIAIVIVAKALKNKELPVWEEALQQLRSNPTTIEGMGMVSSSIKLSYNLLNNEDAKSIFLLCSLYKKDYNINVHSLLRYTLGWKLFINAIHIEEVRSKVHELLEYLKSFGLLLDGDEDDTVKMHDVIRDVAIYIAAKDSNMFTIGNAVNLQEWLEDKNLEELTAISLPYTDVCDLPERLKCPKLKFFLLSNKNSSLQIPDPFFEEVEKLRVLNLTGMDCPHLPSSLFSLENLQSLCLDGCGLADIDSIGKLTNLTLLSLSNSKIKQLPKEIRQLTNLQLLDLSGCHNLEVIPANVLSDLKRLEEVYMGDSFTGWEVEEKSTEGSARVTELDNLSYLTTLNIHIPNAMIFPKASTFEKLVRYKISIGNGWSGYQNFKTSRELKLNLNISFQSKDGIKMLLKSCESLCLNELKGVQNILYELNSDGFPELKHLQVHHNVEIQYIINLTGPQCIAFPVLESFSLQDVNNLEKICHGQLTMESFCNLRKVKVESCDNLKFVFSSSMAGCFPQLQEMEISNCKVMNSIFVMEKEDEIEISDGTTNMIEFTQLCSLKLNILPKLMCFHPGKYCTMKFPSLEVLEVHGCSEFKIFSQGVLSTSKLSKLHMKMEGHHIDSFYPEKDDLNNIVKQYWESCTNKKANTSKDEDGEDDIDDNNSELKRRRCRGTRGDNTKGRPEF